MSRPYTPAERVALATARARRARAVLRARHREMEERVYLEVLERELRAEPGENATQEKPRKPAKAVDVRAPEPDAGPVDEVAAAQGRRLARQFGLPVPSPRPKRAS